MMWGIRSIIPPIYIPSYWQHNEDLFLEAARIYKPSVQIVDIDQGYKPIPKKHWIMNVPQSVLVDEFFKFSPRTRDDCLEEIQKIIGSYNHDYIDKMTQFI